MYFVFYFCAGIFLLGFLLLKFLEIVFDRRGYLNKANRVYASLLFLVVIATFINIIISVYSYRNTINMAGNVGDRGIRGDRGKKGNKGICNDKCGQKVCYIDVMDHANDVFKREVNTFMKENSINTKLKRKEFVIKNGFLLDKINSICKSDQYQTIMLGKHPKKPSEKKLIEYLKGIIEEWIVFLVSNKLNVGCLTGEKYLETEPDSLEYKCEIDPSIKNNTNLIEDRHRGVRFLLDAQYTPDILNFKNALGQTVNPIDEFKKYDIWNWGNGLKINPLEIKIETKNLEKPAPDEARLQIRKSNNYDWVFDTSTQKDKWDDTKCEFNQMGIDKTNPQNLSRCVFINKETFLKDYVNTWKTDVYNKGPEISIYNADSYMDNENNQKFYPVGSVWRGTENKKKPKGSIRTPASKNSCGAGHGEDGNAIAKDFGPEKETILVSGDVKKPEKFEFIWDNKTGCKDCQTETVKLYRPVAPEGYVCLGDYAKSGDIDDSDLDKIRCVPKECVREKKLGNKFYDNKNVSYDKYMNYSSYASRTPADSDRQLSASLWASGMDNIGVAEEQENNYGLEYNDDNGYNLFRTGRGLRRPKMKTYVIKEECLLPAEGKEPIHPEFNASEYLNNNDPNNRYNAKEYFGNKPPFAILTNKDTGLSSSESLVNFEKKPIRIYLEDDLTPRSNGSNAPSDTYFIKTYNPKKNDFSRYIIANVMGEIEFSDSVSKKNKFHRWEIKTINQPGEKYTFMVNIISHGLRLETQKEMSLRQYYDTMAKSNFKLVELTSPNWIYNSMLQLEAPRYNRRNPR